MTNARKRLGERVKAQQTNLKKQEKSDITSSTETLAFIGVRAIKPLHAHDSSLLESSNVDPFVPFGRNIAAQTLAAQARITGRKS